MSETAISLNQFVFFCFFFCNLHQVIIKAYIKVAITFIYEIIMLLFSLNPFLAQSFSYSYMQGVLKIFSGPFICTCFFYSFLFVSFSIALKRCCKNVTPLMLKQFPGCRGKNWGGGGAWGARPLLNSTLWLRTCL